MTDAKRIAQQAKEMANDPNYDLMPAARGLLRASADHITALEQQISNYREWVRKLMRENTLTCVYCGHEYPPGTPAANDEALTAHIAMCEKHPLRLVTAERDALALALQAVLNGYEYTYGKGQPVAIAARSALTSPGAARVLREVEALRKLDEMVRHGGRELIEEALVAVEQARITIK